MCVCLCVFLSFVFLLSIAIFIYIYIYIYIKVTCKFNLLLIWKCLKQNQNLEIKNKVSKVKGSTKINYCPLCLNEKYHFIEYFNEIGLLNKKSEFIDACRHQSKFLLMN